MLRSLYSGISGLQADQTMLDVTANNIANVNTTGFKSSSVQFEDTLSQTLSAAGLAQSYKAGTNPSQVGLGVRVAGIANSEVQGATQNTGNNLDTMISGDGYFMTQTNGQTLYTRDGAFTWDSQGRLATADGGLVQGWAADSSGQVATGVAPANITLPTGLTVPAVVTTHASMTGNLPSDATQGTTIERDINTYTADGTKKTLSVTFTAGATGGAWDYSVDDGSGSPATGSFTSSSGAITPDAGSTMTPTVDGITFDMSALTGFAGLSTATIAKQDGAAAGTLLTAAMGSDGTISGTFSNGVTKALARLSIATFTNPAGLSKSGDTEVAESINSGPPQLGTAGSAGYGTVVAGALEASNVDLSQEFTNLIVAQRGFQANARIITTSDQILQTLVQLGQ